MVHQRPSSMKLDVFLVAQFWCFATKVVMFVF